MCSGIEGGAGCVRACPTARDPCRPKNSYVARMTGRLGGVRPGGSSPDLATASSARRLPRHSVFLLKVVAAVCWSIARLCADDVQPRPNGGSWYGYCSPIGAGLILCLPDLGVRKRAMTAGNVMKAGTSASLSRLS